MVCQLYKTVFGLAVFTAAFSLFLAVTSALAWKRSRRFAAYMAMDRNTGVAAPPGMMDGKDRRAMGKGTFKGMFKSGKRDGVQDERSIMMRTMHGSEGEAQSYGPGTENSAVMPSSELGSRERMMVEGHPERFAGQETRYDPGNKMY